MGCYATPVNQLNGDGVARESTKGSRWFHHGVSLATVTDGRRGYRPGARRRPAPHRRRQHYWGARQRRVASPRRAGPVKELIDGSLSFSPLALFLSFFSFTFLLFVKGTCEFSLTYNAACEGIMRDDDPTL